MKNIFKNLFNSKDKKSTIQSGKSFIDQTWKPLASSLDGSTIDYYKSYAHSAITARAENISKARIYLYKYLRGKKGGYDEIFEHPFLDLVNKPNSLNQSFENLLYLISVSLDLYGNAFLLIERNKNFPTGKDTSQILPSSSHTKGGGKKDSGKINSMPVSFYFLPFNSTSPVLSDDKRKIIAYEYKEGNKLYKIPSSDVIHFLIPNPSSNLMGRSLISAFNFTLDIDYFQNLYQKKFYEHDASPGLIIETESLLNDEQYHRLCSTLDSQYSGYKNSSRTLILDSGVKAKPYKPNPKDVSIIPSREFIRDEILAILRVPKTILGLSDNVNYANAKEAIKVFNDFTIKPFARLCIESKFNIFIRDNYEDNDFKMVMEYEFETDRSLQLQSYEIYRKYDIATVNEIRELEGFEKNNPKN
ncbi:MAG TPA: phage portal protein [Ignavibacteria bacterium]|nr:phage portal protein [Ignavibacteria bacterium]